jgi:hypothetical protein
VPSRGYLKLSLVQGSGKLYKISWKLTEASCLEFLVSRAVGKMVAGKANWLTAVFGVSFLQLGTPMVNAHL